MASMDGHIRLKLSQIAVRDLWGPGGRFKLPDKFPKAVPELFWQQSGTYCPAMEGARCHWWCSVVHGALRWVNIKNYVLQLLHIDAVMQTVAPLCIPAASARVVGALLHPRCLLSDGDTSLSSLMSLSAVSLSGLLDATSCHFKWIEIGSKKQKTTQR